MPRLNVKLPDETHEFLVNYKLKKKLRRLDDVIVDLVKKIKNLKGGF